MSADNRKRSAGTLAFRAADFEKDVANLSVTYDARTVEAVDTDVAAALPHVKRLRVLLEEAEAKLEEWQSERAPGATFVCEKCKETRSATALMYPHPPQFGYVGHCCTRWPRWCIYCVADSGISKCPAAGCGTPVEWHGGAQFYVHVIVNKQVDKRHANQLVAEFGLLGDPAVITLRTVKQCVQDKTGVPAKKQNYRLVGVDKTLNELGAKKGATIWVHYLEHA